MFEISQPLDFLKDIAESLQNEAKQEKDIIKVRSYKIQSVI